MAFPSNPNVGDTHTENNTVWKYAGSVVGWYRMRVSPGNEIDYGVSIEGGGGGGAAGAGTTNLSVTRNATSVTVASDTGTDAILPAATNTAAGVATAAQITKLEGIADGATANSSDATLLARANHTGTQTSGTISDFNSASRAQTEAALVAGTDITITPSGSGATRQLTLSGKSTAVIVCSDETTALTAGTNKARFRMPFAATLTGVKAAVNTAPTGSTLIVDINEAGTSVLGTKLSIDASEVSSTTAASAATITDSSLANDAEISIDIDQIGSTVAGAGLKVTLYLTPA